jgi:hypothetical protein
MRRWSAGRFGKYAEIAAMPVAIIYAAGSKAIRRVIVDDDEARLAAHVDKGEGIVIVGRDVEGHQVVRTEKGDESVLFAGDYPDLAECEALVERLTGCRPEPSRCVVLDGDQNVVSEIMADPLLDAHPDGDVVRDGLAIIGDQFRSDGLVYRQQDDGSYVSLSDLADQAAP